MEENPEIPQIIVENSETPICDDDKTKENMEQVLEQPIVNDSPKELTARIEIIEKSETVSEQINLSFEDSEDSENVQSGTCILKKLEDSENSVITLKDELAKKENMVMEITKEKSMLKRETENAVMRYAIVEKNLLDARNRKEHLEKKIKELNKEIELLNGKIKTNAADKARICNILDGKCHELKNSQKDVEKLKQDIVGFEYKIKCHLLKLKQETEFREAAEKKIEELTLEVNQLKLNEINKAKEEIEVERNMLAEKQMIEQNATLILLKHKNEEKDKRIENLEKNCHHWKTEYESINDKYLRMSREMDNLSSEDSKLQNKYNDAELLLDKQTLKIAELQSNLNDLETIRTHLTLEREANRKNKLEIVDITSQIEEQNNELIKYRISEMEMLQLNKELTETVIKLKNDCSLNSSKATATAMENESIKKDKAYYESIISELRGQLEDEIKKKHDERQLMAKHISEKTKLADNIQKKLDSVNGDLEAQQKKNSQALKELNREINQLRKKCDQHEMKSHETNGNGEKPPSPSPSTTSESESQHSHNEYPTIQMQSMEPSQKNLIDRIVRLQQSQARQAEKIDFLENHAAQLVEELKKKSRLNHHYMLREQSGSLSKFKKIPDPPNMTLELSLEVNKKLQAVLEDTLLKNITLKENLDMLGQEVDQLTRRLAKKS